MRADRSEFIIRLANFVYKNQVQNFYLLFLKLIEIYFKIVQYLSKISKYEQQVHFNLINNKSGQSQFTLI